MIINRRIYLTSYSNRKKFSRNTVSVLISLISFSYLAYLLLYFYETGFLNFHGISSDFVEIGIEKICNFAIIIFTLFGGCLIISLGKILNKDTLAYKFTLFLEICAFAATGYYCYKCFSNFDLCISNYFSQDFIKHLFTSHFVAIIAVFLFTSFIAIILNNVSLFLKKVKHLTWDDFLKRYNPQINIEYTIKILVIFILSSSICCGFIFSVGKLTAETSTYHIGYYQKHQLALIKTMKNGIGIFVPIYKDKKYNKGHFLLLQLGEASINFTEKSKIIQIQN